MGVRMSERCFCVDLRRAKIDFGLVENRRFMYHPDGFLIMGAEGTAKGNGLAKSHAEEYHEACENYLLPPYDAFIRGWIGTGGKYKDGIIHFAPPVETEPIERFEIAFDFIEVALEHGLTQKTVLRGFPGGWEQSIQQIFDGKSVDSVLQNAMERSCSCGGCGVKEQGFVRG